MRSARPDRIFSRDPSSSSCQIVRDFPLGHPAASRLRLLVPLPIRRHSHWESLPSSAMWPSGPSPWVPDPSLRYGHGKDGLDCGLEANSGPLPSCTPQAGADKHFQASKPLSLPPSQATGATVRPLDWRGAGWRAGSPPINPRRRERERDFPAGWAQ
jgi:hypothetical protein